MFYTSILFISHIYYSLISRAMKLYQIILHKIIDIRVFFKFLLIPLELFLKFR